VNPGDSHDDPEHQLGTVLETVWLPCLDRTPADFQDAWTMPLAPYGKVPEELLLAKEAARSLWVALKRKRSPEVPVELLVVTDDGGSDRRGLSVAMAVSKVLGFPFDSTVWMPRRGPDWKASKDTADDTQLVNSHIYSMVRSAAGLVLGDVPLKPSPKPASRNWALLGSSGWLK
jgi:hypothetical protein